MIRVYAPGVTAVAAALWIKSKPIPMTYYLASFYDPASPLAVPAGVVVDMLVDDCHWPDVRDRAAELAILGLVSRVRVDFSALDQSANAGRPVGRVAWVYQDGHQEEV